jgi:hypothetical protein
MPKERPSKKPKAIRNINETGVENIVEAVYVLCISLSSLIFSRLVAL